MDYLRQTIGSTELSGIFQLPPLLRNRRVEVIILPVDESTVMDSESHSCNIGCCSNLPELPDSFFDPLPEEDLRAWGL